MSLSYSTSNVFNQCATCEYWGAPRKLQVGYFRTTIEVSDGDIEGECANEDSLFNRHLQPGSSGCSKWLRWRAIEQA
jgi:hypothetical protein